MSSVSSNNPITISFSYLAIHQRRNPLIMTIASSTRGRLQLINHLQATKKFTPSHEETFFYMGTAQRNKGPYAHVNNGDHKELCGYRTTYFER
jgi:hypothetical protein